MTKKNFTSFQMRKLDSGKHVGTSIRQYRNLLLVVKDVHKRQQQQPKVSTYRNEDSDE